MQYNKNNIILGVNFYIHELCHMLRLKFVNTGQFFVESH